MRLVTAWQKPFCWRKKKTKSDRNRWDQSKRRLGSDRPTTEKGTKRLKRLRGRQPAAGTDTHQDSHQYISTGKCPAGPLVVPLVQHPGELLLMLVGNKSLGSL